jgi:hypothetical protein
LKIENHEKQKYKKLLCAREGTNLVDHTVPTFLKFETSGRDSLPKHQGRTFNFSCILGLIPCNFAFGLTSIFVREAGVATRREGVA